MATQQRCHLRLLRFAFHYRRPRSYPLHPRLPLMTLPLRTPELVWNCLLPSLLFLLP